MDKKFKLLKSACYTVNVTMALVGNITPLLFLTFHKQYGISYSLLGLLVVINFATQLGIDLIFSFFPHKFNIAKTVRTMPALTFIGLVIFSLWPLLLPQYAYAGISVGTVICAVSSGLAEVLISPIIASIPADDPDREMSALHSVYAWGVVGVVIFSTLFLLLFGQKNWYYLIFIFLLLPISSIVLFWSTEISCVSSPEKSSDIMKLFKKPLLWLSVVAIFLGGASEVTMAQWSSSYLEQAIGIQKVWGDIFGVALFGMMLGLGRTLYSKIGKNLTRVILLGALGASVCYVTAALCSQPIIGLIACALTGFCTSMMWPGNLSVATDRYPSGGVVVFALMAAGGDMGASIAPQLVGIVTDGVIASENALELASKLSLTPEQLGMKAGLLVGALFPIIAIPIYAILHRKRAEK